MHCMSRGDNKVSSVGRERKYKFTAPEWPKPGTCAIAARFRLLKRVEPVTISIIRPEPLSATSYLESFDRREVAHSGAKLTEERMAKNESSCYSIKTKYENEASSSNSRPEPQSLERPTLTGKFIHRNAHNCKSLTIRKIISSPECEIFNPPCRLLRAVSILANGVVNGSGRAPEMVELRDNQAS